jgi:hypothetical protein
MKDRMQEVLIYSSPTLPAASTREHAVFARGQLEAVEALLDGFLGGVP